MEDLFTFDLGTLLIVALGIYIIYWLKHREKKGEGGPRTRSIPAPVSLTIVFNEQNDQWEVQNASGALAGKVSVVPGQSIMWDPGNVQTRFDFPTVLFGSVETLTTSESLMLTVTPNTPSGRYVYAVEIDGKSAVGGTPPELEVEEMD